MATSKTLITIPGILDNKYSNVDIVLNSCTLFTALIVDSYDLSMARNETNQPPGIDRELANDEVIELILDDGAALYLTENSLFELGVIERPRLFKRQFSTQTCGWRIPILHAKSKR